jgi:glycogen synthase
VAKAEVRSSQEEWLQSAWKQFLVGGKLNVIWVTSECEPARTGGLGVVSKSIPEALIREKGHEIDIRVILPGLPAILKDEPSFRKTGWKIKLAIPEQGPKPEEFEIRERFLPLPEDRHKPPEQQRGHWQYVIVNEKYFDGPDMYAYRPQKRKRTADEDSSAGQPPAKRRKFDQGSSKLGNQADHGDQTLLNLDPAFAKNMILTRVAAEVARNLGKDRDTSMEGLGVKRSSFPGPVHAIIANDWMSGALFRELAALTKKDPSFKPTKVFYVHNNHSSDRLVSQAKPLGLAIPAEETLLYPPGTEPGKNSRGQRDGMYSPLSLGLHDAELVIGNKNYIKTLTETPFAQGHAFRDVLIQKASEGLTQDGLSRVCDMHHAPADKFNPQANPSLKIDGFHPLDPADTGMTAFKKANKAALQNALGLKKDDKAVIMTWMARLEPRQKGFNLLRDSIRELMTKYPHLQLVIWGEADKNDKVQLAAIAKLQQELETNPALKGRLYLPNKFAKGPDEKRIVQSYAGSDFVILPSMWEPYGLTQLEATVMGAVPLVHSVDGIRSTVSDPAYNRKSWIPAQQEAAQADRDTETVWKYGQTGVMMEPVPVVDYLRAFDRTNDLEALDQRITASLKPGSTDKLTVEGLKGMAKQMEKAAAAADGQDKTRLKDILAHTLFERALKADTLQPAEARRILTRTELIALRKDVQALQSLFQKKDQVVLDAARKHFVDAMDRAVSLAQNPDEIARVRRNGRRYVAENHSEKAIINRFYLPVLQAALAVQAGSKASPQKAGPQKAGPLLPFTSPLSTALPPTIVATA